METANHEPKQKSDPEIKIQSHGKKRNDNRTTEAEIKTVAALHVAWGLCVRFVCVRPSVPTTHNSPWGSFRYEANREPVEDRLARRLGQKPKKAGRRKPQANLNLLLLRISRGRPGRPTQSTETTDLVLFPKLP